MPPRVAPPKRTVRDRPARDKGSNLLGNRRPRRLFRIPRNAALLPTPSRLLLWTILRSADRSPADSCFVLRMRASSAPPAVRLLVVRRDSPLRSHFATASASTEQR